MQPLTSISLGLVLTMTVSAQAARSTYVASPTSQNSASPTISYAEPAANRTSPPMAAPIDREETARRVKSLPRAASNQLYFDHESDGTQWVRGRNYKASFDASGATFIPFLGSRAPRNYPVHLSLASARVGSQPIELSAPSAAMREDTRMRIDRGAIAEVYELSLDSIEQTFVVAERPGAGDLHLFVAVDSEFMRRESNAGVELSNEHGGARYGRAFVRGSNGTRTPVTSHLVEGGIEIVVDDQTLAHATFPLVVDPVLSSFTVDNSAPDAYDADVVFDVFANRYLIAYNEAFSATDVDLKCELLNPSGQTVSSAYVDLSNENWFGSACVANLRDADQFLVVSSAQGVFGAVNSVVRARTVEAFDHTLSPKFNISGTDANGSRWHCDVGGDPRNGNPYYCVVWEHATSSSEADIEARLVSRNATTFGPIIPISTSVGTFDRYPQISKSNGQVALGARWNIAWHRETTHGNNGDIFAAQVSDSGALITPPLVVSTGPSADTKASVSTPRNDGSYMIVWQRDFGLDSDILYALMNGSTMLASGDLTFMEFPGKLFHDQIDADVDTDGTYFDVVYEEGAVTGGFDYDTLLTSVYALGNQCYVSEARVALATGNSRDERPRIAARFGSGATGKRALVGWDVNLVNGGPGDIRAALYDGLDGGPVAPYCFGLGGDVGASCPCNNWGNSGHGCGNSAHGEGALLSTDGAAYLAVPTLRLNLTNVPANVTCTFFQGTVGSTAVLFGDGVRCTYGSIVRLTTRAATAAGTAVLPSAGDQALPLAGAIPAAGGVRYYQVSYRNSANFCTPATLNISNGIRAVWLP